MWSSYVDLEDRLFYGRSIFQWYSFETHQVVNVYMLEKAKFSFLSDGSKYLTIKTIHVERDMVIDNKYIYKHKLLMVMMFSVV